jgi:hypothetical protein
VTGHRASNSILKNINGAAASVAIVFFSPFRFALRRAFIDERNVRA